ncbi:molybdenum cofactor biosynthesis protein MoaE [Parvularcula oceani]|uniref:molybdenum cofactor biosynthesis protein MoaE n=1 Tax=Parvularcula oceani TaxID=1247963 RepID=UPI0004E117A4|nr:molybdenum cofactor biosynthesis protein MoaE [Parvularcula oceani]
MARIDARVTRNPFDPETEEAAFRASLVRSGALVAFTGMVRGEDGSDPVTALELQHYPGMTEAAMRERAEAVAARFDLEAVLAVHRVGRLAPGEPIVLVACAAPHRRAAFEAADMLMDFLKSRAPFWKKEHRESGPVWIEPRSEDYEDARRWDEGTP